MLRKLLASVAVIGTLSACDVEGTLDNIKQDLIDTAFDNIVKDAREHGGEAIMLHPGKAYVLTVNNPASPINGATIKVPADAIPADAENVALSIQTPPATGTVVPSPDDLKFAGPLAAVVLVALPDGTEVKLAKAVNVALPYAAGDTYPAEKLVLSNIPKSGGTPVVVEGSKSDTTKKQVAGDTLEPNLLQAVWPVEYDGGAAAANTFIAKVSGSDAAQICVGQVDDVVTKLVNKARTDTGTTDTIALSVVGLGTGLSLDKDLGASTTTPPTTDYVLTPEPTTLTITCKGTAYTAATVTKSDVTFSNVVDNAVSPTHTISVDVKAEFDFTTAAGEHVIGALNVSIPDFSWAE